MCVRKRLDIGRLLLCFAAIRLLTFYPMFRRSDGTELILVIQLMEIMIRVYTRQRFNPSMSPFLQDLTSARAANHAIRHLVRFEDEPTVSRLLINTLKDFLVSLRRNSLYTICSGSLCLLPLSSFALLQLLVPPLQLPRLAGNPDPPASICALCRFRSQFSYLLLLSTSLGINGSGCPPGSAIYTLSCPLLFYSIARSSLTFSSRTLSR